MRFFNTEGPVRPDDHYAIPSLDRMDVEELPTPGRADGADAGLSVVRTVAKITFPYLGDM